MRNSHTNCGRRNDRREKASSGTICVSQEWGLSNGAIPLGLAALTELMCSSELVRAEAWTVTRILSMCGEHP